MNKTYIILPNGENLTVWCAPKEEDAFCFMLKPRETDNHISKEEYDTSTN